MKTLIIIPAYNEEKSLEGVVADICANASECDYVIINDCSTDLTREVCEKNGFNAIHLPRNLGIGGAIQTGYKYASRHGYDAAVQMDGDGQHPAEFVADVVSKLSECDMAIGSRYINKEGFQSSTMRRMGIRHFSALIRLLTGVKVTDPTSGFRAVSKRVIDLFAERYPVDYPEPETIVLLAGNGFSIGEVGVRMNAREGGKSSITPLKSIYYMIKVSIAMLFARGEKI